MASFQKLLNRFWPAKIRGRLILGIALIQLVLMTAFVLYLVRHQRQFLQKENLQQTFSFVNDYAINSTPFVMANDFDELERLTLSHINFPNLKYAMIISPEGMVLSHTNTNFIGTKVTDSISQQLNLASSSKILVENEHLLDIAVPVIIGKKTAGWARAGVGQDYIQQNMVNIVRRAGLYIVLALVLSILFAVLIAEQLSKGLYQLISTADHIKEGNRNVRAPLFQTFELSKLGTAFNQMLDDISANESLLSLVIESMPVGVWIFNEKREIISGNSAGKRLWEGSKTVGSKVGAIHKAWHADTGELVDPNEWASTRAINKGETTINEEIEIELLNGKRKSLLNSAIPLKGKDNKIIGAIAINVDITERKKIVEQLVLSESTLRSAFDDSAIGMALVLPGGSFQRVNKELCKMLGYTEAELLATTFQQITHPGDLNEDVDYHARTLNNEMNSFQVEKRYIHRNGSTVWAHVSVSLVRDTDGRPLFFVSQVEDIGERKRQEAIILHEKNLSDTMINFMPGIFYLSDLNANLIRWNANLETVSGYSHSEIATMKSTDFVESKQVETVLARRREAVEKGKVTVEVDILTKQGQKLDYYITLIPIIYNNQQCLLGMGVDFSEKKRAEFALLQKNREIEDRVRELRCLYRVSQVANDKALSLDKILDRCVTLISSAFIHPGNTSARITLGTKTFQSAGFCESPCMQESVVHVKGEPLGNILVCLKKEEGAEREEVFPSEKRSLIDSIAEIISNAVEKRSTEQTIVQFSRLFQFTSAINDMMLHADDKEAIFSQACNIAVTSGGFSLAWIGNFSSEGQIEIFASAGNDNGYLDHLKSAVSPDVFKTGAFASAVRKLQPVYSNDISNESVSVSWKEKILHHGYRSLISLPIIVGSGIEAVFTLYRSETFFFNDEEVKLLQEATNNIAYAIEKLHLKELQQQAETELKESEEKFRKLVEETLAGVFILQDGKYVYVNPQFQKISGYSMAELLGGISFEQLIHKDDLPTIVGDYGARDQAETQSDHYTFRGITKNGLVVPIEMIISPISYKGRPAIIGTIIDITEQVEEEKRINKAVTNAQEVERQQISMELHDNVKQMVAASLLNIDFMKMLLKDDQTTEPVIDNIRNYMREAIEELRKISHQLAPSVDSAISLQEKIRTLINTMNVSNRLSVNYHFDNSNENPGADIQLAIYRILQEQFTNILKHSKASLVDVTVERRNGDICLAIADNGVGFNPVVTQSGIGLENIKRRVQVHNGRYFIETAPGKGCKLEVTIPLN
ncbi:MAG: PAS domain S-box protein [Flavisolibacter sp.]